MPRLRRLKNYDYRAEKDYREYDESDSGESQKELSEQSASSFSEPAKGWWSNASIIQGLSEPKIREALAHYRLLINQLEEELILRKFSGHRDVSFNFGNMHEVSSSHQYAPARERKRSSHFAKFLKRQTKGFSSEARLKLEDEWSQILKEYYKNINRS